MPEAIGSARDAFTAYTQAFATLDAGAISRLFHEPALMIAPDGVELLPTHADVERAYGAIIAALPADYTGTDFRDIQVRPLGDGLALVCGHGSWKNAADEDIMPFGMTYTLRRDGLAWGIVTVATHSADAWTPASR